MIHSNARRDRIACQVKGVLADAFGHTPEEVGTSTDSHGRTFVRMPGRPPFRVPAGADPLAHVPIMLP